LAERAVALAAHGLVVHAGVDDAALAAVAAAAVEIGVARDDHAGFEAVLVVVDLDDLGAELVAGDAGIVKVGERAAVGAEVAAADAAVQHLQKRFALAAARLLDLADLHFARGVDVNCLHRGHLTFLIVWIQKIKRIYDRK